MTIDPARRRPRAPFFALALVLLFAAPGVAQSSSQTRQTDAPTAAARQVIPRPKEITATGERFALKRGVLVVPADARSEDDRFAAEDFILDAKETADVTSLRVGRGGGRRGVILVGPLEHARVQAALARARLDPSATARLGEEGYLLSVSADEVVVAGRTPAARFYGMQTLKQLVRGEGEGAYVEGVRVIDYPSMRWRAVCPSPASPCSPARRSHTHRPATPPRRFTSSRGRAS